MALALRKKRHRSGTTVIAAEGGVSLHTSPQLRDLIEHVLYELGEAPHLIIDFTHVDFCDSAGLGVLVTAFKRVTNNNGTFALVCPSGPVLRLLRISGLDTVFPVHSRLDEAVDDSFDVGI
ncbi:MAG: anti-sigma factor antagonist [Streptosporangiales bacterium]|nr:anti-sigma factor antagonist [Streptosporangiales bacterium]